MNLIETFTDRPGNYIIEAAGGFGKSTSLRMMVKRTMEEPPQGKKVLAVYFPLSDINLRKVEAGALFEYLRGFFSNQVTDKSIVDMIADSRETVQYLFLLDGLNEVYNYEIHGQTVLDLLLNDIVTLLKQENVNVILTTRRSEIVPAAVSKMFQKLVLKRLPSEKISAYLGLPDLNGIPGHLRTMLENPMLLKIFRCIYERYPKQAVLIDNKYELFQMFFDLDINIHSQTEYSDHLSDIRKYVLHNILPYAAFKLAAAEIANHRDIKLPDYPALIREAFYAAERREHISLESVYEVVKQLGILGDDLRFTHDLLRDYFAAKGFMLAGERGFYAEVEGFLENLVTRLRHTGSRDLVRRTQYLDLADFIFSSMKGTLAQNLVRYGSGSEKNVFCLSEEFYQELSGVYDDLSDGVEAARVGWIALDYLKKSEGYFSAAEAARRYSFIYYSVKWDRDQDVKCYEVIQKAKRILDETEDEHKDKKYYELYGKVLSNIGSYFYKLGLADKESENKKEYRKHFQEAQTWHEQALVYRKKHCGRADQAASFRTLMSDAFQLEDFEKSYQYYRDALLSLNENRTLEEALAFGTMSAIPEDLVERALGSEVRILNAGDNAGLIGEIKRSLQAQIRYVYDKSTASARSNIKMINSLEGKIEDFLQWAGNNDQKEMELFLEDYLKRCQSYR